MITFGKGRRKTKYTSRGNNIFIHEKKHWLFQRKDIDLPPTKEVHINQTL